MFILWSSSAQFPTRFLPLPDRLILEPFLLFVSLFKNYSSLLSRCLSFVYSGRRAQVSFSRGYFPYQIDSVQKHFDFSLIFSRRITISSGRFTHLVYIMSSKILLWMPRMARLPLVAETWPRLSQRLFLSNSIPSTAVT